jgi:hypothetical protein
MSEQKIIKKIIGNKEFQDISSYCESLSVPYKLLKPILAYIEAIPNDQENADKSKKS